MFRVIFNSEDKVVIVENENKQVYRAEIKEEDEWCGFWSDGFEYDLHVLGEPKIPTHGDPIIEWEFSIYPIMNGCADVYTSCPASVDIL